MNNEVSELLDGLFEEFSEEDIQQDEAFTEFLRNTADLYQRQDPMDRPNVFKYNEAEWYAFLDGWKAGREFQRNQESELLAAAKTALNGCESWIHDQLDGTNSLDKALAELQPVRDAISKYENNQ
jgi:hypothetical protein